MLVAGAFLAL